MRAHEVPLRKIFKRYSSMMGDSLQKIRRKSQITTLDIDSFIEFACDYAIVPDLVSEDEARKMYTDLAHVSLGLGCVRARWYQRRPLAFLSRSLAGGRV